MTTTITKQHPPITTALERILAEVQPEVNDEIVSGYRDPQADEDVFIPGLWDYYYLARTYPYRWLGLFERRRRCDPFLRIIAGLIGAARGKPYIQCYLSANTPKREAIKHILEDYADSIGADLHLALED